MNFGCECDDTDRAVVKTVDWQRDFCNNCGQPIHEGESDADADDSGEAGADETDADEADADEADDADAGEADAGEADAGGDDARDDA